MLFSKILVAYDGSSLSKKALAKAVSMLQDSSSLSRMTKVEVVLVYQFSAYIFGESYVAAPAGIEKAHYDHHQALLDEAIRLVPAESNITFTLKQGDPAKVILDYAEEFKFDLIVMGSRGLGGIRQFILGSVSHNVVQHSKVPVLIIK